jgi:hypothetical protein
MIEFIQDDKYANMYIQFYVRRLKYNPFYHIIMPPKKSILFLSRLL